MLLRPAQPHDAPAVARLHVRTWQIAYRGLIPQEYLDQMRPEDRAVRYTFANPDPRKPWTTLAEEAGEIRGFATTAPAFDSDLAGWGELCALYVDPDHWGRGIGAALIAAARARLRDLGFRDAVLWVLEGNTRADRFYRIDGWTPDGARKTRTAWGLEVAEVRYVTSITPRS